MSFVIFLDFCEHLNSNRFTLKSLNKIEVLIVYYKIIHVLINNSKWLMTDKF